MNSDNDALRRKAVARGAASHPHPTSRRSRNNVVYFFGWLVAGIMIPTGFLLTLKHYGIEPIDSTLQYVIVVGVVTMCAMTIATKHLRNGR